MLAALAPPRSMTMVKNARVGLLYTALALVLIVLCIVAWPWGAILLWPIVSLGVLVTGYFGPGAAIYRKRNGRLPLGTRIIMGPVLLGQYLSLLYYRRQCRAWDAVAPGVWLGRRLNSAEAAAAVKQGVTAVVDLCGEFSEARPFLQLDYFPLPVLDLTAPSPRQLSWATEFIDRWASTGIVYVHCKIGYSRSAAIVGAWLLASGRAATADEAIAQLRAARPSIVVRPEIDQALRAFQRQLAAATSTEATDASPAG